MTIRIVPQQDSLLTAGRRHTVVCSEMVSQLFASSMALLLAALYCLFRVGMPDLHIAEALSTAGLSMLLIHGEVLLEWGSARAPRPIVIPRCGRVLAWWFIMAAAGWICGRADWSPRVWLAPLGLGLFGWRALKTLRTLRPVSWRCSALVACLFMLTAYMAFENWNHYYHNPLLVESLAVQGLPRSIDPFYHVSLATMLQTYDVSSTGLNGLPYVPYHYGSHWLIAQFSNLVGTTPLAFYQLGHAVVFLPMCVLSLLLFALGAFPSQKTFPNDAPDKNVLNAVAIWEKPLFWLLLCAAFVGVISREIGYRIATAWGGIVSSESYTLGVAFSLLSLGCIRSYWRLRERGEVSRHVESTLLFLVFPTLLAVVGFLKISLMLILVAVLLFFWIRLGLYRSSKLTVVVALHLAVGLGVYSLAAAGKYDHYVTINPFGFMRTYVTWHLWGHFLVFHWFWTWALVGTRLYQEKSFAPRRLWQTLRARRLLDVELAVAIAVVGAGPGLLGFSVDSCVYFSDYQRWMSAAMLLGVVARSKTALFPAMRLPQFRWRSLSLRVAAVAVAVQLVWTMSHNVDVLARSSLAMNTASRGLLQNDPQSATRREQLTEARAHRSFRRWLNVLTTQAEWMATRPDVSRDMVQSLMKLHERPRQERRRTLLYIPKTNRAFWDIFRQGPYHLGTEMIAPVLAGTAMVDGLPEPTKEDLRAKGYGYMYYEGIDDAEARTRVFREDNHLNERVRALGFARVVTIPNPSRSARLDAKRPMRIGVH